MDDVTIAHFTTQIASLNLAVHALIATHPNPREFAADFRERVMMFQSSGAVLVSDEGARDMFREQCESLLEEAAEK